MRDTDAAVRRAIGYASGIVIPVIDVGPCFAGVPGARERTARQLGEALQTIGFFVLVNHGVPRDLIARTFDEARRFHAQPMAAKMALRMNEHNNGYMAMGRYAVWTSDVNDNDKPDLNEAYFTKRERTPDDPLVRRRPALRGPEPVARRSSRVPRLGAGVHRRDGRADAPPAADRALALDLPPDAFDAAFAESQFSFRLSHYPPVAAEANQFGIAPHTDANFLTFLAQSEVPGLQVRIPSGEWIDVPYVPDSYAVNSGDMMARWTNGRFKSTPHRAVPPVGRHRYAIPFFLGPHIDTVIACLPTCQSADNPPRFEPITYDAYLHWWYDANYNAAKQNEPAASAS